MSNKEKLIALISEIQTYGRDNSNISAVCKTSNEALADHLIANGVVVREKGEWEYTEVEDEDWGATWHKWICSNCGYSTGQNPFGANFCPNCGADMRKEENR